MSQGRGDKRSKTGARATHLRACAAWLACLTLALPLPGCGNTGFDIESDVGRAAILFEVNKQVDLGNCARAVTLIEPLYLSEYTNDEIRQARASARACAAGLRFFQFIDNIAASTLVGSAFFRFVAERFPGSLGDNRVESAWAAMDALSAITDPLQTVASSNQINAGGRNIGSTLASQRTDDANFALLLTSMASLGTLQNRYSATNPTTFAKTQVLGYTVAAPLGWATAVRTGAVMNNEGCSYASALLTFIDSVGRVGASIPGTAGTTLTTAATALGIAMNIACEAGCNGAVPTGCALPLGSCAECPQTLRNRSSCTGTTTDVNSCAAAGIAHYVNVSPAGWQ